LPTLPTQRQLVDASVLFFAWPVYFGQSAANGGREVGGVAQRVRRAKAWSEGIIDRLHNIHVPLYDIQVLCGERQSTGEVSSADSLILSNGRNVFLIYSERADQGAEQRQPR